MMDMSPGILLVGLITSSIGTAYVIYGKKRSKFITMIAGVILCVISFFISDWRILAVVSALIAAIPFVVQES
jgi:hypothetical protein